MAILMMLAFLGLATAQAAEPTGTLTLACQGTVTDNMKPDAKPEPISAGMIFNFAAGTVQGFPVSAADVATKITHVTETAIQFRGERVGQTAAAFIGVMDRVTGDLTGVSFQTNHYFQLKCKPTQRMF
jgi:hypothetical protein